MNSSSKTTALSRQTFLELPFFYLHEAINTAAADKKLRGYLPSKTGALHYHGGGLRTAYMAS
jgi:hypothetical protein